jgi:hypothetical protein
VILNDLLDELRINILNDRSDRTAGTSDYLWTDATLVRYINEAQRRFAVRGLVIRDGTTAECTEVTLEEGVTEYKLHDAVIAVVSAKIDGESRDLIRANHSILGSYRPPNDSVSWDMSQYADLPPGSPRAYTTDEQVVLSDEDAYSSVSLRIYPEPDADADGTVIKLRVVRKPLEDLTVNNLSASPEIPTDHHLEMLDWAAYLALRIVDADAGNPKRAMEFAQSFEEHVRAARTMVLRKLFAPKPWGFGRGGFSWES